MTVCDLIMDEKLRMRVQKHHQQITSDLTVGKEILLKNCMTVCDSVMIKKQQKRVQENHQQKRFHLTVGKEFLLKKL